MKLIFKNKYLSISEFNDIELNDFTILTGINGSGKSHLLEAIENKNIIIEELENPNIVRFNYENFKLENENSHNAQTLASDKEAAWGFFEQQIKPTLVSLKSNSETDYNNLNEQCLETGTPFWSLKDNEHIKRYRRKLNALFSQPNVKNTQHSSGVFSLIKKLNHSMDEISHDTFIQLYKPFNYKNDFLPQELGKIIWDYYLKYRNNQVNEYENEKHGKTYKVLEEEEFISINGEKPWDILNEVLIKFESLDYSIPSPEGTDVYGNYQLKLLHKENESLEVSFSNLSSGERVLMALVACIYKASSDNHFPDVLLLDELDASLHPSMMKNMLAVIADIFLERNIKVILVTHSPTTIALAPAESIYLMNKKGLDRIVKCTPQEALTILTEGFATLDEGITIFDAVTKSNVSIITEGKNTSLISKALDLFNVTGVNVITGFEDASGKEQLKTLFNFFCKVKITKKVIFIWDCDVNFNLDIQNNVYPLILEKNTNNNIASKGIENMFPEELFEGFIKTTKDSKEKITKTFDGSRKNDFAKQVIERNNKADFNNFQNLINMILEIQK